MSHYPSTQELAAFRRSIEPAMRHTESGPVGAYPHELHDGIGYRDDDWLGGSAAPVGFRYRHVAPLTLDEDVAGERWAMALCPDCRHGLTAPVPA